jgi:hypothetical protein
MGAFLMQAQLQQSSYSSALFLTSGAQNLLCLNLAAELGEEGSAALLVTRGRILPPTSACCSSKCSVAENMPCALSIRHPPESTSIASPRRAR